MENLIWYAGAAIILYFIAKLLQQDHSVIDKELDEILSKEEHKVKGRLDI